MHGVSDEVCWGVGKAGEVRRAVGRGVGVGKKVYGSVLGYGGR